MGNAYGEAGPWGVWLDKEAVYAEPRWLEHHRGGAKPYTEEEARALADTLTRGRRSGVCEARPLMWSQSKNEYVAR
jgi:hypothetical protein